MTTRSRTLAAAAAAFALLGALLAAGPVTAGVRLSSNLLLPYFVVDLGRPDGATTLFAVGNSSAETVPVRITVLTNWGIPVLEVDLELAPDQVRTFNLRDWLNGAVPGKLLSAAEKGHLHAALCGLASPKDDLYYSTEIDPDLAFGSVLVTVRGGRRPEVLFGDFFVVDPGQDFAQGDVLVGLDLAQGCGRVCQRHALRFLVGGAFDGGTRVMVWTGRRGLPSPDPYYPTGQKVSAHAIAFSEAGERIDERALDLLPLAVLDVAELGLDEPFGWIDLRLEEEAFLGLGYAASGRFSIGFESYCLPDLKGPGLRIEKSTNGQDADSAPGASLAVGSPVAWEYAVTNTGDVALSGVTVSDDDPSVQVSCPKSALAPGESMICTAGGVAAACGYRNVGTATGSPPEGPDVQDSDASHYFGGGAASIDIEKSTNHQDADSAPGPELLHGAAVTWTYRVTNDGGAALSNVVVTDDQGEAVSCPRSALAPGESMTCTAQGTAELGQYRNVGTVTGETECGGTVSDSDASHYFGTCPDDVGIDVEKATNGHDADSAPGPELAIGAPVAWTYVVTNTGSSTLRNVSVADDQGVAVSCPKSTLAGGESMTCTGNGTAVGGQYRNVATATGTCACGTVSDTDPSHYYGACTEKAKIDLEKKTNGYDADSAPGPELTIGSPVAWTYRVSNAGDSQLSGVAVTDDQGVAVSCPKSSLAPGESMTCTGGGTAVSGQYRNVGTATAASACGASVSHSDPSHYYGACKEKAKIKLQKKTNGHDADEAPGPYVYKGSAVTWTYHVTNAGDSPLSNLAVTDDQGVAVSCPKSSLAPGESMTCTGNGTAIKGQYRNLGTVTATSACGATVSDTDPSHYYGKKSSHHDDEGCTPGYWKNHTDSWPPTGYSPSQSVKSVFSEAWSYGDVGKASLLQALHFGGGSGDEGAARILLRAAVAALLNASHPSVDYPRSKSSVIDSVDFKLDLGSRHWMLELADDLDEDNNEGCPLD